MNIYIQIIIILLITLLILSAILISVNLRLCKSSNKKGGMTLSRSHMKSFYDFNKNILDDNIQKDDFRKFLNNNNYSDNFLSAENHGRLELYQIWQESKAINYSIIPEGQVIMPERMPEGTARMPERMPEGAAIMPERMPEGTARMPERMPEGAARMPERMPEGAAIEKIVDFFIYNEIDLDKLDGFLDYIDVKQYGDISNYGNLQLMVIYSDWIDNNNDNDNDSISTTYNNDSISKTYNIQETIDGLKQLSDTQLYDIANRIFQRLSNYHTQYDYSNNDLGNRLYEIKILKNINDIIRRRYNK